MTRLARWCGCRFKLMMDIGRGGADVAQAVDFVGTVKDDGAGSDALPLAIVEGFDGALIDEDQFLVWMRGDGADGALSGIRAWWTWNLEIVERRGGGETTEEPSRRPWAWP